MWEQLLAAILRKDEVESLRLIDLMKPEDSSCTSYTHIPLYLAASNELEKVVNKLISIVDRNKYDYTALHYAAQSGNETVVNKLLTLKPELAGVIDKSGYTALHYAIKSGNEAIVDKLLAFKPGLAGVTDNKDNITALHDAVQSGNEKIVNKLLSIKPDLIDTITRSGYTSLHYAAQSGSEAIVNKLLTLKPELAGVSDNNGKTALHHAAQSGNEAMVDKLLTIKPELAGIITKLKEGNYTALHYAAQSGSEAIVNKLLSLNPDLIDKVTSSGYTALHYAAQSGSEAIVNKLLSLNPDLIDKVTSSGYGPFSGYTALHIAANKGSEAIVDKLLAVKPELAGLVAEKDSQTALHIAANKGSEAIVDKLLAVKPELARLVDRSGQTSLHHAARSGNEKIVNKLLSIKPDLIDKVTSIGCTALHHAAQSGSETIVDKLLSLNPDLIRSVNISNYTALHYAAQSGNEKIVNKLLSIKPDLIDKVTENNYTALHHAAQSGNEAMVDKLLMLKPELAGVVSKDGYTTIHYAAQSGSEAIVDKLLSLKPDLIDKVTESNYTALHYAAKSGNEKIVNKLLSIKPNLVEIITTGGYTALDFAAQSGNEAMVDMLLKPELAKVNQKALYILASFGKYDIVGCFTPKVLDGILHSGNRNNGIEAIYKYLNDSIYYLTKLIKDNPDNANYQYKIGNILLGLGRKEEGMKAYEEALRLDYAKYHEKINNNLNADEQLVLKQGTTLKDGSVIKPPAASNENNNELSEEMKRKVESIKRKVEADIKSDIERAIIEINELEQKLKLDMEKINQKRTELEKELQLLKSYEVKDDEVDATNDNNSKLKASSTGPEKLKQDNDNNDGALAIKQAKVENNTNLSDEETANKLNVNINQEKLPLATTSSTEKTDLMIANKKAKAELEKASANKVKKQLVALSTSNSSSSTDDTKEKETIASTKTDKAATESLHGVPAIYSNERISKLLNALEKQDILASIIDLEAGKLAKDRIESLIKPVMEEGKTASMALHLRGECWASLVIKKQGDNLQVIYNDPKGNGIKDEKNVKSLINTIKNLEEVSISTYDLMVKQQLIDGDSAALVIDNLTTLAKANTSGLKKPAIQKLLAKQDQINDIKSNHSIMLDDNPWYGDSKIDKLLQLKLAGQEQVSIAPSVEFERKELLVENISVAAREVMDSGKIAVMPIHLHDNHWTALVIKKQTDDSLQILYNDPKGNSLMSEKNSGALIKAISKINAEFTVIDIRLKQQDNDDDGGPYTLENLIKLATEDTSSLQDNNFDAVAIRTLHADALNKAGIAVVMPKYSNNDKVEEISQFAVAKENIDGVDTRVDFLPPSPVNEKYETEAIGLDSNH